MHQTESFLWCFQRWWPEAQKHKSDMIVNPLQIASSPFSFQVVLRSLWTQPVHRITLVLGFRIYSWIEMLPVLYSPFRPVRPGQCMVILSLWPHWVFVHSMLFQSLCFIAFLRMLTQAGEAETRGLVASEVLRNPGEVVIMMVTNLVH